MILTDRTFYSRDLPGLYVEVPKQLYIGQLDSSNGILYTAPTGTAHPVGSVRKARIDQIWISNTDAASARNVYLYAVPAGSSAADSKLIIPGVSFSQSTYTVINCNFVLEAGGTIQGRASAANIVTVLISGVEFQ